MMPDMEASTEYTLQGVMRFLQIEWHNHERARNAWDIERAEMKAKIAKQEGDCRSAKKLNEMLEKQVKMLERALKHERAKNKATANGEPAPQPPPEEEVKAGWDGKIGVSPSADLPGDDISKESLQPLESEREAQRDKSKVFLQKCLEELTYLLTPPAHPIPSQLDRQSHSNSFEAQDISMHDAYAQQQPPPPRRRNPQLSHLPSLPNHPPPTRSAPDYYQSSQHVQPDSIPHHLSGQPPEAIPNTADDLQPQPMNSRNMDEPIEQITHSFDAYGRQIPSSDVQDSRSMMNNDTNGWDFDDSNTLLDTNPPDTTAPPRHGAPEQTDQFPNVNSLPAKSPPRTGHGSHRRKSSGSAGHLARKRSEGSSHEMIKSQHPADFRVKFAFRGHLDVVRSVIFTGGGSPSEPEVCTTGDDGTIKRWIIPASYAGNGSASQQLPTLAMSDTDIQSYFTHRGHEGAVTCLAACPCANSPASPSFSTGGRAAGDGWIFSGGQDATIRVWERGRVDPKATLDGHTDAVWALAVLPANASSILAGQDSSVGNPSLSATTHPILPPGGSRDERILLASGAADGSVKIWAVSAPPQLHSPSGVPNTNAGVGGRRGSRRLSVTSGSNFPSSPQPSTASSTPFHYQLLHNIDGLAASPTSIAPLGPAGESFVVAFADAQVVVFDTRTGESVVGMQSQETYDGTSATGINSVVVAALGVEGADAVGKDGETEGHGATGSQKDGGVEGVIITGHEDRYVRFFDANSGQCTYSMLAHSASIASLSLSPDGRELLTTGHDASVRIWSLEKRTCTQETTCHRVMRGEGVVSATWSFDGRWIVTGAGDGVVKVFSRG